MLHAAVAIKLLLMLHVKTLVLIFYTVIFWHINTFFRQASLES